MEKKVRKWKDFDSLEKMEMKLAAAIGLPFVAMFALIIYTVVKENV